MGRIYQVTFEEVSVTAAQDLVQITIGTKKVCLIHRVWLGCVDVTLPTGQDCNLRCRYLPSVVTVGSGGTVNITPSKRNQGDAACSSTTCATNNTTQATTNGTAVVIDRDGCYLFQGFNKRFEHPPDIPEGAAFVFELLDAPSGTVKLSGGCEFEELG